MVISMQYSKFVVDEKAWCVWDLNLRDSNLVFIEGIDPSYFEYLAHTYANSDEDQAHNMALALRTAYSHGLETFFALLFATLQAPDCVIGWVHKYDISDIKSLLQNLDDRCPVLSKIKISPLTWNNIAYTILSFELDDKEKEMRIKQGFANTWEKFANDFMKSNFLNEYNSIKHGFRAKSSGSWLAIGVEKSPGVSVPQDQLRLLNKSEFGSTFYTVEPFDVEAVDKTKRHFRLLKHTHSWQLEKFFIGLHLISLSIQNVLSFLKILNGVEPTLVTFVWPDNETHFQEPWKPSSSTFGFSMNNIILPEQIEPFGKDEILSVYQGEPVENQNKS
jgi:hypothetical protein